MKRNAKSYRLASFLSFYHNFVFMSTFFSKNFTPYLTNNIYNHIIMRIYRIKGRIMIALLGKIFIKDHKNYSDKNVREKYGFITSICGIAINLILFAVKLFAGIICGAVSVTADAFNNLSDAVSSLISLLGFKISSKPKDEEHPFGHGRMEYVASFAVAVLILFVGYELLSSSIEKIIRPQKITVSVLVTVILSLSVAAKIYMFAYNRLYGKKLNSPVLKATAADSISDAVSTSVVLLGFCLTKVLPFSIDGYIGVLVAIFIVVNGIKSLKDSINLLMGEKPDKELVEQIETFALSYDVAVGLHDLIIHNYGIGQYIISLHVEVDAAGNVIDIHEKIDEIEQEMNKKFNCLATIHMDPVFVHDEATQKYKTIAKEVVEKINPVFTIHDFRMTDGKNRINLIFDVVIPSGDKSNPEKIEQEIKKKIKEVDERLNAVVKCEYSFV